MFWCVGGAREFLSILVHGLHAEGAAERDFGFIVELGFVGTLAVSSFMRA